MATAKFDIKSTDLKTQALKPVLAYVGVTDLAVETVREAVADVQKRVAAVQKDVKGRVADVQKFDAKAEAKARRAAIEARVADLQAEAKAYPTKVSTRIDENVAAANATYTELVKRGESLVGRIRRQESTTALADFTVALVDSCRRIRPTRVSPRLTRSP